MSEHDFSPTCEHLGPGKPKLPKGSFPLCPPSLLPPRITALASPD